MIEKKIKEKLKDIVFIELKKSVKIKDITIEEIPFPVKMNNLLEGIKNGEINENFDVLRITEGIVFLLGIEPDFKYSKEYCEIIKAVHPNTKDYILYLSKKYLDLGNTIESYICLLSQSVIVGYDSDLYFTKLGVLEEIYNKYEEELDEEEKQNIIEELLKGYEQISIKENYPLSYYKLGHINLALGNHLKAMLYFKKFLNNEGNDELKNEVRAQMDVIEDYARVEEGEAYLRYGKFNEAESAFNKVSKNYTEQDKILYYKSVINYHLGNYIEANDLVEQAIELEKREEYYNHIALVNVALDKVEKSINWFEQGLEAIENSYTLNYNLGLLYYNLHDKKAKEYFIKANEIKPSEQLKALINEL